MGEAELTHLYDRARGELRRWMPLAPYVESWITYERTLLASSGGHCIPSTEETTERVATWMLELADFPSETTASSFASF